MSKQDRTSPRTPADLERKWSFGKNFSEVMGVTGKARAAADDATKAAAEANKVVNGLDQTKIFNLLTNDGKAKGIYMDEDGEIYINAAYLASGIISSADGKIQINLGENAGEPVFNTGVSTNGIIIRADEAGVEKLIRMYAKEATYGEGYVGNMEFNSANGVRLITVTEGFTADYSAPVGVSAYFHNQAHNKSVLISTDTDIAGFWLMQDGGVVGSLLVGSDGKSSLTIDKINGKTVSWKDNGDGTYSLIGTD